LKLLAGTTEGPYIKSDPSFLLTSRDRGPE